MLSKKILITNDDGVDAVGIMALAAEMTKFGEVTVLAPDRNWSASGHGRTLDRPLRVKEICLANGMSAFAADGSPADCVALGVRGFLPFRPDLVVSGINTSANLGQDVLYSGTVSAAAEASLWGIPAIAVSLDYSDLSSAERNYATAAQYAGQVVENAIRYGLKAATILNVNIPDIPREQIAGIRATRLGNRVYNDRVVKRSDPRGKPYYWLAGKTPGGIADTGTDIGAIAERFVSVTPLHLDMTEYFQLLNIASWDWTERIPVSFPAKKIYSPELISAH